MMLVIGDILKQSRVLVNGSKKALWSAIVMMLLINTVVFVLLGLLMIMLLYKNHAYAPILSNPMFRAGLNIITPLVLSLLIAPILTGLMITALKRCRGESIKTNSAFSFKNYWLQTSVALTFFLLLNIFSEMICSSLAITLITLTHQTLLFWAMIIAGNVISVLLYSFLFFSLIIIVEQDKKAIPALIASAKLVASRWLSTTALYIITFAIIMVSSIPLFLSTFTHLFWVELLGAVGTIAILVWTLPYCVLIIAMTYQKLSQKNGSTENSSQDPRLLASS